MNREAFQKLVDRFEAREVAMSTWERTAPRGVCGTTRCMAGWAIYDRTGTNVVLLTDEGRTDPSPATLDLAAELGIDPEGSFGPEGDDPVFVPVAAKLLGLSEREASIAFYLDNFEALRFCRAAAAGDFEGAREILRAAGD